MLHIDEETESIVDEVSFKHLLIYTKIRKQCYSSAIVSKIETNSEFLSVFLSFAHFPKSTHSSTPLMNKNGLHVLGEASYVYRTKSVT